MGQWNKAPRLHSSTSAIIGCDFTSILHSLLSLYEYFVPTEIRPSEDNNIKRCSSHSLVAADCNPPPPVPPSGAAIHTGNMSGLFAQLDQQLTDLFAAWNIYTTALTVAIVSFVAYGVATQQDPDTHPLILSRQSAAGSVRNEGESAIYRSPSVPHGYPLRTGLNVKEKGAPTYASGKDGDLRDIWRRVTGELPVPEMRGFGGTPPEIIAAAASGQPKIFTVMGREEIIDHDVAEVTKEITIIGEAMKSHGRRVAIYLPNSIEFLSALFGACSPFRKCAEFLLM